MGKEHSVEIDQAERTLKLVTECEDIMFEHAPVMLIAMNEEGVILKVNQQWLGTMGYELDEVLGRKSIDFMTEESGSQAVADALPLFWQAGRAHSIGCELVRKDGRVLDVLLDAYVIEQPLGERLGLASLWERSRDSQRLVASTVVRTLLGLIRVQRILYGFLPPKVADETMHQPPGVQPVSPKSRRIPEAEDWDLLSHIAQEVSSGLHSMADVEEVRMHSLANQRQKLLLLAETVETTLGELTKDTEKSTSEV